MRVVHLFQVVVVDACDAVVVFELLLNELVRHTCSCVQTVEDGEASHVGWVLSFNLCQDLI